MARPLLTELLNIRYPVLMAPMFLVTNDRMLIAAGKCGISGVVPALNFRTDAEFRSTIATVRKEVNAPIGVNLIVNKSNPKFKAQLKTCIELGIDYIVTSLGNPKPVIEQCKKKNILVFCDVTDLDYAKKVEALGADAVIAVNSSAGGHAGGLKAEELIPLLLHHISIPVISAGGVGTNAELKSMMALGASGVSVGTVFIASEESPVSREYKQACIDYDSSDIVLTDKISGSPCTVINTPFVQKIGTKQGWLGRVFLRNRRLRKWFKMLTFLRGMKALEKAAFSATYKTVWCAGPSIRHVYKIRTIKEIIADIVG